MRTAANRLQGERNAMQPTARSEPPGPPELQPTLVISAIRLLRESLIEILARSGRPCAGAATLSEALAPTPPRSPTLILLDSATPEGPLAATRLARALPAARVVVFGIVETEEIVLAWAEAGVAGYVPNTASVADLLELIDGIARGEQACPSRIAGSLLRRLAAQGRGRAPAPESKLLTRREQEILRLVSVGLSNKDIARRLSISLGTTKTHVHNVLGKLHLQRRAEVMVHVGGTYTV
jgi:two-component system nitrate/nitrite response regulator NarL